MAYPPVVVVDQDDAIIGSAMLADAWAQGLIHRIVMVIVEDGQGRVLLHKRAATMSLYADRWDTVGGHVDVSPDYKKSAMIELEEEAGITEAVLHDVAHLYCEDSYDNGVSAKRFIQIYRTTYTGEAGSTHADEVADSRWFTRAEVAELASRPEEIAECLHRCLPYILEEYEDHQHQTASQTSRPILDIR